MDSIIDSSIPFSSCGVSLFSSVSSGVSVSVDVSVVSAVVSCVESSDVETTAEKIIEYGGDWVGELTRVEIKDVGVLVFAYMRDPEGNILEIQRYEK